MNQKLQTPWIALRVGIGVTATIAGLDTFFNVLAAPAYEHIKGTIAHASY